MPYKKSYTKGNVKSGGSRTPKSVQGSKGKPAHVKGEHYMSKKGHGKRFGNF